MTVSGTNANAGEIHVVLSGTAQSDVVADAAGVVRMLFYSDCPFDPDPLILTA